MIDIERYFSRAQVYNENSQRCRWALAIIAYRVVGLRDGMTMQLAQSLGLRGPDAVEHWRKAHDLYKQIRFKSAHTAHKFRDEFTVSHFYSMYDMVNRYNLTISQVIGYFRILLQYKETGESWSVAALEQEVEADHPSGKAVNYNWHINRMETHVDALLTFPELPHVWRAYLRIYKGLKGKIK